MSYASVNILVNTLPVSAYPIAGISKVVTELPDPVNTNPVRELVFPLISITAVEFYDSVTVIPLITFPNSLITRTVCEVPDPVTVNPTSVLVSSLKTMSILAFYDPVIVPPLTIAPPPLISTLTCAKSEIVRVGPAIAFNEEDISQVNEAPTVAVTMIPPRELWSPEIKMSILELSEQATVIPDRVL
jgi:hypothetical protein